MRILITGADGQLGYQLQRVFGPGNEILATDYSTLDITNPDQVNGWVEDKRPELVLHAAAYTNVDGAEAERDKAFLVNATGTENMAKAAQKVGAKLVYISTDFVFDGKGQRPYRETDTPGPLSVYGESKLAGEKAVMTAGGDYLIARTAWLYGERGKNFVETILRLAKEKPELQIVDDQVGSPTYTADLAAAIKQLVEQSKTGIYHVVNSGQASWYEFAKEIVKLAGLAVPVRPISSQELDRPAKRPAFSVLDMSKLAEAGIAMRLWTEALAAYMRRKEEDK